nr:ABC transporter ATP-binding protein [uncultured Desulfuromonas sp.]
MASRNRDGMSMVAWNTTSNDDAVVLKLEDFSFSYQAHQPILSRINLTIRVGECHCLCGATGQGKSTLALAMKGLLDEGQQDGCVYSSARRHEGDLPFAAVGLVLQNPETQLFARTVGAEVAFGLENEAVDPAQMRTRVESALAQVNLNVALCTPVTQLSMGQKYRLLIASVLVLQPQVLILDEPVAQLDEEGQQQLVRVVRRLLKQGIAVVLCEHNPQPFSDLIDHYWTLYQGGRLVSGRLFGETPDPPELEELSPSINSNDVVVKAEQLSVGYGEKTLWKGASFVLRSGEKMLVCGDNGCGKSTLMQTLCGFLSPRHGELRVLGHCPSPQLLQGSALLMMQNPHKQLTETSVWDEVSMSHRLAGHSRCDCRQACEEVLEQCGIDHLKEVSPHQLSYGQRHLVALASVLVARPKVLLMDDPFAGLDRGHRQRVHHLMDQYCQQGMAVICVSHESGDHSMTFDQVFAIRGGHFEAQER